MITRGVLLHSTGWLHFSPHQRCYYTSQGEALLAALVWLINVCERKNLVSTLVPPPPPDQPDAGLRTEFEVFCSTEFGFAAPGLPQRGPGGRENVKIIIQPQIKSPRFINTVSSSVRRLGSGPRSEAAQKIKYISLDIFVVS